MGIEDLMDKKETEVKPIIFNTYGATICQAAEHQNLF